MLRPLMVALAIGVVSLLTPAAARAASLVIDQRFAQDLIAKGAFNENGRWYLQRGNCYAYLEYPKVSLANQRVVLDAHLSSRLGTTLFGDCVGPGFASNVTLSGRPAASGTRLILQDIRIDRIDDKATRNVIDIIETVSGKVLPSVFDIDLQPSLKNGLAELKGVQLELEAFSIRQVLAEPGRITLDFDFRLRAR